MSNLAQRVYDFQKQCWGRGHKRVSGMWYHTPDLKAEVDALSDEVRGAMWKAIGELFRADEAAEASRMEREAAQKAKEA